MPDFLVPLTGSVPPDPRVAALGLTQEVGRPIFSGAPFEWFMMEPVQKLEPEVSVVQEEALSVIQQEAPSEVPLDQEIVQETGAAAVEMEVEQPVLSDQSVAPPQNPIAAPILKLEGSGQAPIAVPEDLETVEFRGSRDHHRVSRIENDRQPAPALDSDIDARSKFSPVFPDKAKAVGVVEGQLQTVVTTAPRGDIAPIPVAARGSRHEAPLDTRENRSSDKLAEPAPLEPGAKPSRVDQAVASKLDIKTKAMPMASDDMAHRSLPSFDLARVERAIDFRLPKSPSEQKIASPISQHVVPLQQTAVGLPESGGLMPILHDVAPMEVDQAANGTSFLPVPAAPSAQPTIVPFSDISRQIAQHATAISLQVDQGSIEIALNPEELGKVRLNMVMSDGAIVVHIAAERIETLQMMRRNIEQLSHEFHDLGFGDVNFSFDQQRAPQFARDDLRADRELTFIADETMAYPAPRKAVGGAGGLDMRV